MEKPIIITNSVSRISHNKMHKTECRALSQGMNFSTQAKRLGCLIFHLLQSRVEHCHCTRGRVEPSAIGQSYHPIDTLC